MNETRKRWTRDYISGQLAVMEGQLFEMINFDAMPASLRRRLQTHASRTAELRGAFRDWPITKNEKLRKDIG